MAAAIRIVESLYADGLLERPVGWAYAPDLLQFYEAQSNIEQELYTMFMEYRMRAFQGAFTTPQTISWYGWAHEGNTLDEGARMTYGQALGNSQASGPDRERCAGSSLKPG
jgi:hypothetical protein